MYNKQHDDQILEPNSLIYGRKKTFDFHDFFAVEKFNQACLLEWT